VLKFAVELDPSATMLPDQLATSLQRPVAVDVHVPLAAYKEVTLMKAMSMTRMGQQQRARRTAIDRA
jgi:hypothetical protein